MWPNPQETADLVTFTEEILNGKLHFLCSEIMLRKPLLNVLYISWGDRSGAKPKVDQRFFVFIPHKYLWALPFSFSGVTFLKFIIVAKVLYNFFSLFFSEEGNFYIFYFYYSQKISKSLLFLEKCDKSIAFNPLSANLTKWSNTLKQFVGNLTTNCLSVSDHFVKLALKGVTIKIVPAKRKWSLSRSEQFYTAAEGYII